MGSSSNVIVTPANPATAADERRAPQLDSRGGIRYLAAAMAFALELIFLWMLPGEYIIWPVRGVFFLIVAMAEGALAVNLLFNPRRWTIRLGILLNVTVVTAYVFSRVVGVPSLIVFIPEPVGVVGSMASALACALIGCLAILRRRARLAVAPPQRSMTTP